jgi:hypothetical protein
LVAASYGFGIRFIYGVPTFLGQYLCGGLTGERGYGLTFALDRAVEAGTVATVITDSVADST